MKSKEEQISEIAKAVRKELADKGKIIEGGWAAFKLMMMIVQPNAPQIQLDEMRTAFYGGAQHLWSSIMASLDPGLEETPADLRRFDLIQKEFDAWWEEVSAQCRNRAN